MNQADVFNTPSQEAMRLADEIRSLREVLREVSSKLGRIEGRARLAFPSAFPKSAPHSKQPERMQEPTMMPSQLLGVFDEMVEDMKREEGPRKVQDRLGSLSLGDLFALFRELGLPTGKSKPSRNVLARGVMGRIHESIQLSKHIHRVPPSVQGAGPSAENRSEVA